MCCPRFLFPYKLLLYTPNPGHYMPNTGHYMPKYLCSSPNFLIFIPNLSSGFVPVSAVHSGPSVCGRGGGGLCCTHKVCCANIVGGVNLNGRVCAIVLINIRNHENTLIEKYNFSVIPHGCMNTCIGK